MLERNKEYIVKIESLGYEGEGVAKIDGYPIFIPGALVGETVKTEIIKNKKNYSYGRLIDIVEKCDERTVPECSYYEKCGGCTLMHSNYDSQLKFKYNRVRECIERIGGLSGEMVKNTIGMEFPYRYRNKGIYSIALTDNELSMGFFSEKTHEVVDMDKCLIQDEETDKIIKIIRNWMKKVFYITC